MAEQLFGEESKKKLNEANVLTTKCRDCGIEIWFLKNTAGKLTPMELNLEIHKCPNREPRGNFDRPRFSNEPRRGVKDREWDREKNPRW